MPEMAAALRSTIRGLSRSPGFTLVVVLTLALGIGVDTAIFALVDPLLVRSLPVPRPERLVILDAPGPYSGSTHNMSDTLTPLSHPMYRELRDGNAVFSGVLAHFATPVHVTVGGETEAARGDLVSGTFFPVLGVAPAAGRLLSEADDVSAGAHPVVVLGHAYWTRRFAARPEVVGETILVNGHPMTVVGVSARGFHGVEVGQLVDLYVPLAMQPRIIPTWGTVLDSWRTRWLTVMARLADGVPIDEARAGANLLYQHLLELDLGRIETRSETFRQRFLEKQLLLLPGGRGTSNLRATSASPLLVLMAMAALVLAIAGANVVNLLGVRLASRRRELALRIALGASRRQLVGRLLIESLVLALAAGLLGILLASWMDALLVGSLPLEDISVLLQTASAPRLALFTGGLSALAGLALGTAASLRATRPGAIPGVSSQSPRSAGAPPRAARLGDGLVVLQLALSLLLLVLAGLFARSLLNLGAIDPGFETESVLSFDLDPSLNGYDVERRVGILRRILDGLASEPGVRSASLAEVSLLTDSTWSSTVSVEGYEPEEGENMNPNLNGIAPGFFGTLGMPIVAGRDFTSGDDARAARVAIVNETFARYFFDGGDAVGRRIGFGRGRELDVTIVGVVRDGKSVTLKDGPLRYVYTPFEQSRDIGAVTFYVKTDVAPKALSERARAAVARVDDSLPVSRLRTLDEQLGESLFAERLIARLSLAFGALATLLAAVGLYGLVSYRVATRTREMGIRLALGANRRGLVLFVLRHVLTLALLGLGLGLVGGYGVGRLVQSQLYGLGPADPVAIAAATALLALAAGLAGGLPAARASSVDPVVALRDD